MGATNVVEATTELQRRVRVFLYLGPRENDPRHKFGAGDSSLKRARLTSQGPEPHCTLPLSKPPLFSRSFPKKDNTGCIPSIHPCLRVLGSTDDENAPSAILQARGRSLCEGERESRRKICLEKNAVPDDQESRRTARIALVLFEFQPLRIYWYRVSGSRTDALRLSVRHLDGQGCYPKTALYREYRCQE